MFGTSAASSPLLDPGEEAVEVFQPFHGDVPDLHAEDPGGGVQPL
jgi:hypothetical protein